MFFVSLILELHLPEVHVADIKVPFIALVELKTLDLFGSPVNCSLKGYKVMLLTLPIPLNISWFVKMFKFYSILRISFLKIQISCITRSIRLNK